MLHDADIRDDLCDHLEQKFGKVRFFEELNIGRKTRADVVAVTEEGLYGLEIKSDADTYARLERQIKDYQRFFDFNYVVVGSSHAAHIKEHVPEYWGVMVAEETEGGIDLYEMRAPQISPKVKLTNQLSLLWRSEFAVIQAANGLYKYGNKSKMAIKKYVMAEIEKESLRKQMLDVLFERDYSTSKYPKKEEA